MEIAYHGRNAQTDQSYRYFGSLEEMAQWSDVMVVLVPETPETVGMVDRRIMAALGSEAYLINVARGPIVEEGALVEALETGLLGGAGLDVFEHEPRVPEALIRLDNVVLQPHVASGTVETRRAMGMLVVNNLLAFYRGETLLTPVN